MIDTMNFDITPDNDEEEFAVDFGEVQRVGGGGGTSDFNQLTNRPKYNDQKMTGDTNIPEVPAKTSDLTNDGADGTSTYVEANDLAKVAATGEYGDLSNTPTIPIVNDATLTITQNGTSKGTFTANDSDDTTIELSDTTYSNFTGTDGQTAGTAGLVPAPATTDADKFLKSDGTWDTAGGGGGDTVYSDKSTSDSTTGGAVYIGNLNSNQEEQPDPTTEDLHQRYFWALPYTNAQKPHNSSINIFGQNDGNSAVTLGANAIARTDEQIAIGPSTLNNYSATNGIAIGKSAQCLNAYSVAVGKSAKTTRNGEFNIGAGTSGDGYNSTNYRVLGGVHDPIDAHDAATKNYVDSIVINYATLTAAGAPTTSTAATSVGQLYYDSTNDDYYYCSAIDTTDPDNPVYTWNALSTGGGGGDTVYSTKTTSNASDGGAVYIGNLNTSQEEQSDPTTTDNHYKYFWALPSSNANIPKDRSINLLGDSADEYGITIGAGAYGGSGKYYSVIIGSSAYSSDHSVVAIGMSANGRAENSIAIGRAAKVDTATYKNSIALGSYASVSRKGEVNVGTGNNSVGYNNTDYRVIGGVHDGQLAQDAVTVNQINNLIDAINTAAGLNISHIGA